MSGPLHEGPKRARLESARDFKAVYRAGRSVAGKYIVLYYVRATGDRLVGFTSARAVATAVARNRVRRVLRAAWGSLEPGVVGDSRIVIMGRPSAAQVGCDEVTRELGVLLARAGLSAASDAHEGAPGGGA